MTMKIAGLLLIFSFVSSGQQILTRSAPPPAHRGDLAEDPPLVGIQSTGIDADGRTSHLQGISRVGPPPPATAGPAVMQGAMAGSSITYTCDATINTLAGVCTTLNTTIASLYTSRFTDVNANIYIRFGSTGLGQSNYPVNSKSYTTFRNALNVDQTDASDVTAFNNNVPATNPINASSPVWLTNANARALGFTANNGLEADASTFCAIGTMGCYDGIITISSTEQTGGHLYYRVGSITGTQFDFYTVVEHETDEILGTMSCAFGGCGSSSAIAPSDLYRYSSTGIRSFAPGNNTPCSSSNAGNACFSLDGMRMLQQYNNLNNGQDAGDWVTNCANTLVQDAALCSGVAGVDVSSAAEILVLDVVGYNLVALDPTAVSPAFGSGLTQTFTYTFNAPNGWQSLSVVDVLINSSLDGTGACYLAVVPSGASSGSVLLVDDAGDAGGPLAAITLPGSGTVQNSQCSVAGAGSSLTGSGNTLTVTLSITFKAPFAGTKIAYMAAQDTSPANSGWQALGVWSVPGITPSGPAVGGVSPGHSSSTTQAYTFTFTDTSGFADIAVTNVLINNFLNGIDACYVAFVPSGPTSGSVLLVDDAGDAGGPFTAATLPGTGTAQNSQCSIAGAGSSVSSSGNTMTLVLNITFKPAFSGNKVLFMAARSNSLNSGWQSMGTVDVP